MSAPRHGDTFKSDALSPTAPLSRCSWAPAHASELPSSNDCSTSPMSKTHFGCAPRPVHLSVAWTGVGGDVGSSDSISHTLEGSSCPKATSLPLTSNSASPLFGRRTPVPSLSPRGGRCGSYKEPSVPPIMGRPANPSSVARLERRAATGVVVLSAAVGELIAHGVFDEHRHERAYPASGSRSRCGPPPATRDHPAPAWGAE